MRSRQTVFTPSLYIQNEGEDSTKTALSLTRAKTRCLVRLTGGCGLMSQSDAENLYDLFVGAFAGFDGAMLFGGTRMVNKDDVTVIIPGITEIPPLIKKNCWDAVILGVIPKTSDIDLSPKYGMIVSKEADNSYITVVHPEQDMCLIIQGSVDRCVCWDTEFEECIKITEKLRQFADWDSLLVSYNGGGTTEKEIVKTAALGWPVLLIDGSGRKTEEYANNTDFLRKYPNVSVVEKDVFALRRKLTELGVLPRGNLVLVERSKKVA